MGISRLFLGLSLLGAIGWNSLSARADVELYEVQSGSERLQVALIHADPRLGAAHSPTLEKMLAKSAEVFMIREYLERKTLDPKQDMAMIQHLRTTESVLDGRSHLIMVMKAPTVPGELGEVIGMMRVANRVQGQLSLPYEARLGRKAESVAGVLETMPPTREAIPASLAQQGRLQMPHYKELPATQGVAVEAKNLVLSKRLAPPGLISLLFLGAENAGWFSRSLVNKPGSTERYPVSSVVLETDPGSLQRRYQRMKFHTEEVITDPHIQSKKTAIMRLDRTGMLALTDGVSRSAWIGAMASSAPMRPIPVRSLISQLCPHHYAFLPRRVPTLESRVAH